MSDTVREHLKAIRDRCQQSHGGPANVAGCNECEIYLDAVAALELLNKAKRETPGGTPLPGYRLVPDPEGAS